MTINIFKLKFRLRFVRGIILSALIVAFFGGILSPTSSLGFWPFTSKSKGPYIVKIGDEIITKEEFIEAVNNLHKSGRVGKALSEERSFVKQDFGKFLDEIIDDKLMVVEAVNLRLDKEAEVISKMDNYILNLSLDRLRQDEILNKVKVDNKEIEDYYQEQLKKKEEEKKKAQENANKEKADKEKIDAVKVEEKKEEPKKEDVKKEDKEEEAKKEETTQHKEESKQMSSADREVIRKGFFDIKAKAREKEYFALVRQRAKVKINDEVLRDLSFEKTELMDKAVAEVNGETILGIDLLGNLSGSQAMDEVTKKEMLDRLILYKTLDQEAMNRGYEEEDEIQIKIKKYREQILIDQFKRKAILPAVKVGENDILESYKANQEKYKESDRVNLRMIHVLHEKEAKDVFSELKKGADFSYLAKEKSIDPSKEKGGDIGWVPVNQLPEDTKKAIVEAKQGDMLGPFQISAGYVIIKLLGFEKGGYIPLEKVRNEIDKTIGREKFNSTLKMYIKQLRETISIEINQRELDNIQGR